MRVGSLFSGVGGIDLGLERAGITKPECWLDYFETVSPGPYLEMFARRNRLGWDTWGNESFEHVAIGGKT